MILAEKLQFPTVFSQKFNKNSPWQQWVADETNMYLKWKLISLY